MITLFPFQELGRDFLALRQNALLADDMGLGKTYQALEAIKKLRIFSGIVICPQSIRRSWVKRIREQIPLAFIKEISSPKIVPEINAFNVVNYDIVWKEPLISLLKEQQWPVMICDESHYLKNIEANRTRHILGKKGLYNKCARKWLMTGTPLLNRPIELYPALRSLFPEFMGKYTNFYDFAYRYCAGHQGTFGFDCTGASNLEELSLLLRPIMLRRLKSEVQKELPQVSYEKIYLDPTDKLVSLTEQEHQEYDARRTIGESSTIRKALGLIKSQAAIKHLADILEEKEKVAVFIWHKDVAQAIFEAFPGEAVLYTGEESAAQKDAAIAKFQIDPWTKIFIGNIQSAGVGLDGLQFVCDVCVFVEMSYVPEMIRQVIGRLDRIGQKHPVLAQFLISENSVDEDIIDRLTEKAKNINTILGERREQKETEFVETRCKMCGEITEMKKLKRVARLTVCENCRKNMECLL